MYYYQIASISLLDKFVDEINTIITNCNSFNKTKSYTYNKIFENTSDTLMSLLCQNPKTPEYLLYKLYNYYASSRSLHYNKTFQSIMANHNLPKELFFKKKLRVYELNYALHNPSLSFDEKIKLLQNQSNYTQKHLFSTIYSDTILSISKKVNNPIFFTNMVLMNPPDEVLNYIYDNVNNSKISYLMAGTSTISSKTLLRIYNNKKSLNSKTLGLIVLNKACNFLDDIINDNISNANIIWKVLLLPELSYKQYDKIISTKNQTAYYKMLYSHSNHLSENQINKILEGSGFNVFNFLDTMYEPEPRFFSRKMDINILLKKCLKGIKNCKSPNDWNTILKGICENKLETNKINQIDLTYIEEIFNYIPNLNSKFYLQYSNLTDILIHKLIDRYPNQKENFKFHPNYKSIASTLLNKFSNLPE